MLVHQCTIRSSFLAPTQHSSRLFTKLFFLRPRGRS